MWYTKSINSNESGSHWVAYYKNHDKKYYFDSYGKAHIPKELVKYLGAENLFYNSNRFQNYNDPPICGHLCLIVLEKLSKNSNYEYVLRNLDKSEVNRIVHLSHNIFFPFKEINLYINKQRM